MSTSYIGPVFFPADPSRVTEEAGTRGGQHYGMDFGLPVGTPVTAPFDGTVVWVGNDGASGYYAPADVWANGPALVMDFQRSDGLVSRFAHLDGFHAKAGDAVTAGSVLAFSGNTGFSTGPHLHWELRWDRRFGAGRWVNPRAFNPEVFSVHEADVVVDDLEDIMAIYLEATGNSSPIDAKNPGSSRIWAGADREINGAKYSPVWERSDDGSIRRLFAAEWVAIQEAYKAAGRKVPLVTGVHGNAIEEMYLTKRAAPSK